MNNQLSKRDYEIIQKTPMTFGSIMNGLQSRLEKENDWSATTEKAFRLARKLTEQMIDDVYHRQEAPQKDTTDFPTE